MTEIMSSNHTKSCEEKVTVNINNIAYLQPTTLARGFFFDVLQHQIYFHGLPQSVATLRPAFKGSTLENVDWPLLHAYYSIVLQRFAKTWQEDGTVEDIITMDAQELTQTLCKDMNLPILDLKTCIDRTLKFHEIVGVVKSRRGDNVLPLLLFCGNDIKTNTIKFASPYMVKVLQMLSGAKIRKSKTKLVE